MRSLSTYIHYLLVTQHYVYVPGHGAYMLSDDLLTNDESTHPTIHIDSTVRLQAPQRQVRFTPLSGHDDGMLVSLMMEAEGFSYDEATHYIARQVALLPEDFAQQLQGSTYLDNYGFSEQRVKTWRSLEREQQRQDAEDLKPQADVIAIPRYWLRRVAVVALVFVCFFASFLPAHDPGAEQYAALFTPDAVIKNLLLHTSSAISGTTELDSLAYDSTNNLSELRSYAYESINGTTNLNSKQYFIIVGSYASAENAQTAIEEYAAKSDGHYGIMQSGVRYRVYINCFEDAAHGQTYLNELRKNEVFQRAWMMPARQGDYQLINIKKTYNDNQLSLELSHPNQRTERDQG